MNDPDRKATIFELCQQGNVEKVKSYVCSGGEINVKDGLGWSPLHLACLSGNSSLVQYLVEETDADLLAEDNNGGLFPFDRAFLNGKLEIMHYLMKKYTLGWDAGSMDPCNFTQTFLNKVSGHCACVSLENIVFVRVDYFLKENTLPSYATCAERGWHMPGTRVCEESSNVLYVCHKWHSPEIPDKKDLLYGIIKKFLEQAEVLVDYIWLDWCCVCPDRESEQWRTQWRNINTVFCLASQLLMVPPVKYVKENEEEEKGPSRRPGPPPAEKKAGEEEEEEKEPEGTPTSDLKALLGRAWVTVEVLVAILRGCKVHVWYKHGEQINSFVNLSSSKYEDQKLGSGDWFEGASLKAVSQAEDSEVLLEKLYNVWFGTNSPLKPLEKTVWLLTSLRKKNKPLLQRLCALKLSTTERNSIHEFPFLCHTIGKSSIPHDKSKAIVLMLFFVAFCMNLFEQVEPMTEILEDPDIMEEQEYIKKLAEEKKKKEEEEAKKKQEEEEKKEAEKEKAQKNEENPDDQTNKPETSVPAEHTEQKKDEEDSKTPETEKKNSCCSIG